jgi:hypothetical protein
VLEPVGRLDPRLAIPDARVVNDGIERTGQVGLFGHATNPGEARQISDEDPLGGR